MQFTVGTNSNLKIKLGDNAGSYGIPVYDSDDTFLGWLMESDGARSPEYLGIPVFAVGGTASVGSAKGYSIPIPAQYDGFNITDVRSRAINGKGSSGTMTLALTRDRAGNKVAVLSTNITHGDEWECHDGVINTSNDDVQQDDMLLVDVVATRDIDGLVVLVELKKPAPS